MNSVMRMTAAFALVTALMVVSSCGGGGGNDGGGGGQAVVMSIAVQGVGAPIYTNGQAPQIVCPVGSFLNSTITMVFGGPVDPASIPPNGAAAGGSIQIVDQTTAAPAVGIFTIDPVNPSIVRFTSQPPIDPAAGCAAGFSPDTTYTIFLPDATGGATEVVSVGGSPLLQAVTTCFRVVPCPGGQPFVDPNPGPPAVVGTTPMTDGTAPSVTQAQIEGNPGQSVITIDVNEALDPVTVSGDTVLILNTTANGNSDLQSPGQVAFQQFGTIPGSETVSRITFTTFSPLVDGDVFEIQFSGVADLGGNMLTVPAGSLLFTVADNMDDLQVTFMDSFDDTMNLDTVMDAIEWLGDGQIRGTFPLEIVGNGLDGAFQVLSNITVNTDNQMTPGDPNAIQGIFNYTSVDIQSTIVYRSTTDAQPGESNWPVRIRSIGMVDILPPSGTVNLNCVGRPGQSSLNNVPANSLSRFGGHGGPGAGTGGIGSPNTGGASPNALPGEGGHIDANNPNLPGGDTNLSAASPFFGGGGGGAAGAGVMNTNAAAGGAGGTASSFAGYMAGDPPLFTFRMATNGETHQGTDGMGLGAPPAGAVVMTPPAMMIPPLMDVVGGSGGGGGGDRVPNSNPSSHNAGAGGGGGGGTIRITSAENINIGDGTTFRCEGGVGGAGIGVFIGGGGGGSGGSIIVQTFAQANVGLAVDFQTRGGLGNAGSTANPISLNGEGGDGGDGVVQIEDTDGTPNTELVMQSVFVDGELFAQPFALSGAIPGMANSNLIDTGSNSVDFVSASATVNAGTAAMSVVDVQLIGVAEDPANPGQPATTMTSAAGLPLMVGPVPLNQASDLNGYRWFRFQISTSFAAPPLTNVSDTLPFVEDVTVVYITNM